MKKRHFWIVVYIILTAFIFIRSSKPASISSAESHGIVIFLEKIIKPFIHSSSDNLQEMLTVFVRKTAHVVEFTALSGVACRIICTFGKSLKAFFVWVLFSGLFTACVDEAIQITSPGRAGLISDVFIDFSGTLLGLCISLIVVFVLAKKA